MSSVPFTVRAPQQFSWSCVTAGTDSGVTAGSETRAPGDRCWIGDTVPSMSGLRGFRPQIERRKIRDRVCGERVRPHRGRTGERPDLHQLFEPKSDFSR